MQQPFIFFLAWNLQSGGVAMDTSAPWVAGAGGAASGGGPPGPRAGTHTLNLE